ncbi:unnamed protein product, partial [marine sediment metagenome]
MPNPVKGVFRKLSKAVVKAAGSGGPEKLHVTGDKMEGDSALDNLPLEHVKVTVEELRQYYWDDPVVSSSVTIRLLGTLPGSQIKGEF